MLIIQCIVRYFDARATKRRCPDCGRKADADKGKRKATGDEEENLLGEEAEQEPSEYRDEEAGGPAAQA